MIAMHFLLGAAVACAAAGKEDNHTAARPHFLKGLAALDARDYGLAITAFSAALQLDPSNVRAWHGRALASQRQGQNDQALADYEQALRIHPDAVLYTNRALIHAARKEYDRAIADFTSALRLDPNYARAYENRARAHEDRGDHDRALADLCEVVRLAPHNAQARTDRGDIYALTGDYERAVADYRGALHIDPHNSVVYNSLAWLWASCPRAELRDGNNAVAFARQACKLTLWKCPAYLDTLAAAYAEAGDFKQAVEWEEKALGLSDGTEKVLRFRAEFDVVPAVRFSPAEREEVRRRLDLYRQGKLYREMPQPRTR